MPESSDEEDADTKQNSSVKTEQCQLQPSAETPKPVLSRETPLAFFSERILLDNDEEQMTQPGYYHGQSGGSNSAYYPSPYRMLAEEQTTLERTG